MDNDGFGSPVFLFYSPLLYYVMSLFEWLSPLDPHGFGRVALGMALALLLSGITSFRWLESAIFLKNRPKTAHCSMPDFPYLAIVVYIFFGRLAQLWAVALFPVLAARKRRIR